MKSAYDARDTTAARQARNAPAAHRRRYGDAQRHHHRLHPALGGGRRLPAAMTIAPPVARASSSRHRDHHRIHRRHPRGIISEHHCASAHRPPCASASSGCSTNKCHGIIPSTKPRRTSLTSSPLPPPLDLVAVDTAISKAPRADYHPVAIVPRSTALPPLPVEATATRTARHRSPWPTGTSAPRIVPPRTSRPPDPVACRRCSTTTRPDQVVARTSPYIAPPAPRSAAPRSATQLSAVSQPPAHAHHAHLARAPSPALHRVHVPWTKTPRSATRLSARRQTRSCHAQTSPRTHAHRRHETKGGDTNERRDDKKQGSARANGRARKERGKPGKAGNWGILHRRWRPHRIDGDEAGIQPTQCIDVHARWASTHDAAMLAWAPDDVRDAAPSTSTDERIRARQRRGEKYQDGSTHATHNATLACAEQSMSSGLYRRPISARIDAR
ncbi:hypothetical protein DFH09DRAFT_1332277 [Mycena vulgaris]|nr:hypothetical protein DFH09DRAFT_1332277 [Mycena vulgaris]